MVRAISPPVIKFHALAKFHRLYFQWKFAIVYAGALVFYTFEYLKSINCKYPSFKLLRSSIIHLHLNIPQKHQKNLATSLMNDSYCTLMADSVSQPIRLQYLY